jgi:hypothetical protein
LINLMRNAPPTVDFEADVPSARRCFRFSRRQHKLPTPVTIIRLASVFELVYH